VWFSSYASGQTDRQTDMLITVRRTPSGESKVTNRKSQEWPVEWD